MCGAATAADGLLVFQVRVHYYFFELALMVYTRGSLWPPWRAYILPSVSSCAYHVVSVQFPNLDPKFYIKIGITSSTDTAVPTYCVSGYVEKVMQAVGIR